MTDVQRYRLVGDDECPVLLRDATGDLVLFTDHERALTEARMDTVARMDQWVPADSKSVYEKGWNAALDAVQQAIRGTPSRSTDPGTFGDVVRRIAVTAAVERLRKAPVGE